MKLARLSGVLTRSSVLRPATLPRPTSWSFPPVGLCPHALGIGDGFSWKRGNGNELWDLMVVRNLFTGCVFGRSQVTSSVIGCAMLNTMLTATDSTHRYDRMPQESTVIHRGAVEEAFLRFAGNAADAKFCRALRTSTRGKHHHGPH